jgi:hypothetical protein
MSQLIEVPLESGGTILIEAEAVSSSTPMRGGAAKKVIEQVEQTFEAALDNVRATASAVITKLRDVPQAPEEVTVEFGIKFGAKGSIYIAGGEAEANFKVALKWKKETAPAS